MTFKSLFGQIKILSLNLVDFRVPRFYVSHLTHETFKLHLQNTLNMSKTTRVYFRVLHVEGSLFQVQGVCTRTALTKGRILEESRVVALVFTLWNMY